MLALDGLKSLFGKLGDPNRDKASALVHTDPLISDDQLLTAYRCDWISKKIVDIPADDALRKWRTWPADYQDDIAREERRLSLRRKTMEAVTKGRLYGGAALYVGISGQDPAEPLDTGTVKRGGIDYLTVMTRRELTAGDIETDPFSAYYGKPRIYTVAGSTLQAKIHPSRLAIFGGDASVGGIISAGTVGWDESVLIATDTIVKQALGTFGSIASLIHEANVDVIAIPDLARRVSTAEGEAALLNRFTIAAAAKGINGMLILDKEEEYQRRAANFANLETLMEAFARMCAAAADIPVTRFLAQSPSGLVATGEHDMSNYFNKIAAIQALEIEPAMRVIDECVVRSALGDAPEDATFEWAPLQQMSERELAEIGKMTCESLKIISELGEGGSFTQEEIREITIHRLSEIGAMPHFNEVTAATASAQELEPLPDPGLEAEDE